MKNDPISSPWKIRPVGFLEFTSDLGHNLVGALEEPIPPQPNQMEASGIAQLLPSGLGQDGNVSKKDEDFKVIMSAGELTML